ncbi:MAG: amylo-alpha-1,6-glucosidase, partial [Sinobacteraceae bacterium]|nr:amylo-alpha-1,6-glucosidase [Nevskiaceae bacterium]
LWGARLYERLIFTNFSDRKAPVPIRIAFEADFADIFEVQGHARAARGEMLAASVGNAGVRLGYLGRDGVERNSNVDFSVHPERIQADCAEFLIELERGATAELYMEVGSGAAQPSSQRFESVSRSAAIAAQERLKAGGSLETTAPLFDQWIRKSRSDLVLLMTPLETGPYPYAGIPWFCTQFGRDAVITALQTLWLEPRLAAGVLRFLASTQATETSNFRDSEPGKIIHEMRRGEMATLCEVPFGRYYGGVDTTPLFIMLAGEYEERTGDRGVVDAIWPNLLAAIDWVKSRLQRSATGFLDYVRGADTGLVNQAWKDSADSIFYADGQLPTGPLAVVEVQGYACAALEAMARLGRRRHHVQQSEAWQAWAAQLRNAIEERFWIPEMNFYAIAIDADGKRCAVRASNAGHLLFCGIPDSARAAAVTSQLTSDGFSSGWGIRTLRKGEARYNPMSYHNGSIWPHDTAICGAGMARYGCRTEVARLLADLFEAANQFSMRLPELFCGFSRNEGQSPVPYPVACLPQAWASGSVFLLLQSVLGITIDGFAGEIHIRQPQLPLGVETLQVRALPIGTAHVDLQFYRVGQEVGVVPVGHIEAGISVISHL